MRATWLLILSLAVFVAPAMAYEAGGVEKGATIRGTVRLEGPPPRIAQREVFVDEKVCGARIPDESVVLGPGQEIRYAVVSLEGVTRGKPIEEEALNVLQNKGCRFVPHVLAAPIGQYLLVANEDPIPHLPDALFVGERKHAFHYKLPPRKQARYVLLEPGLMRIGCNERHAWMDAYVVVTEHPYVAVTDERGAFELREVPPGRYTLKVWHERLGLVERPVTIAEDGRYSEDLAYLSQPGTD